MGKPKAPTPPSPRDTSAAQTGTSVATAVANTALGNVNQVGADGSSLTYSQSGQSSFTDPYTGKTYQIPNYTATQKLGAGAQGIFDTNMQTQQNLATTGRDQSAFLKDYLGTPWKADTGAIESHLFDLGSKTLDPKFQRQQQDLDAQLANQGIKIGSEAYTRAKGDLGQTQNAAYTDLALRGRGQGFSELLTQRNQPINEITALMGGSQVQQPNYTPNTPASIPTTDNAALINANYNQQQQNYGQKNAQWNSTVGGLFGLGAAKIMASDERLKKDIKKVGKTDDGQKIYSYRYKGGGPIQMGMMAQEVEKRKPAAVKKVRGIRFVDYGKALSNA